MTKENIHVRARRVAAAYLHAEAELIDILQILDGSKAFVDLGYSSLAQYCVGELKIDLERAYVLITIARKAKEIPELKQALEKSEISLTNARLLVPILTKTNKTEWLEKAQTSKRELEKELKRVFPERVQPESLRFVGEDRLHLSFELSEAENQKIERARDVLAQKANRLVSRKDLIMQAVELYLEKMDPVRKAERILSKSLKTLVPERVISKQMDTGHVVSTYINSGPVVTKNISSG